MKTQSAAAGAIAAVALASSAQATNLLHLANVTDEGEYNVYFKATSDRTTLSVGGWEYWSWIIAWNNVVTDGGPNLLGSIWDFTPSPDPDSGNAYSYDDGTPVPDLNFGSWKEGAEDIFSQTFATVPNTIYRYSFHYYNRGDYYNEDGVNYGSPSGLDVSANADAASAPLVVPVVQLSAGAVPEPSAWTLMIAGVGLTGAVLRGRRKALPA